ncbi:MAG: Flp pilus assembly protein CpaB [Firmicutes bacterium]|nr:Flp pilus assembly protein CpaB [Bacillota bacterium]
MRSKVFLILALIFAVGAALSAYLYLESVKQAYREAGKYVTVITAAGNIPARTVVTAAMIQYKDIPERYAHPDALRSVQEIIGKTTLVDIAAGEQILKSKLATQEDKTRTLSLSLSPGERAVTVKVDEVSGVGYFVQPGDKVDVLVTLEAPSDTASANPGQQIKGSCTSTVISNVRVLATGQNRIPNQTAATAYPTVTLAVYPLQAQQLILASARGSVGLVLRSPVDEGVTKLPSSTLDELVFPKTGKGGSAGKNATQEPKKK